MRKSHLFILASVILSFLLSSTQARDTQYMLSIEEALKTVEAQQKLDNNMIFEFGRKSAGTVIEEAVSNRKTNAFGKSDKKACEWAFLSAMIALQEKAKSLGANKVTNIQSYYKKNAVSSQTEYECHAGAVVAGVALKGSIVK
jgi:uncharacterized protein YbjQ (UPF0145 family)